MHERFLRQAVELACRNVSERSGGPYGAIIVKDGRIIAGSGNRVTQTLDPTAHAEIVAIREACRVVNDFQLSDCVLYSNCEPCPMCLGAVYWARLAAVYYASDRFDAAAAGFDDDFIYRELEIQPQQRAIPMRQLALESASAPFELWRAQQDKILY